MQQAAWDKPSWGWSTDTTIPWGWHHPQFYRHRIAESKANSKSRLELPQYLSPMKITCLKSSSPGLQAAPPRAQCSSYPSAWSQTRFAKMGADAMSCPGHGWGDSSSVMPKGWGRGKHTMESPAAAETSSKMREFSLFHTHWQQTNDLPIRRAGQAWKMTSHRHTFLHYNGKLKTFWYWRKHFVLLASVKISRLESPGNAGTNACFPKMHEKSPSQQTPKSCIYREATFKKRKKKKPTGSPLKLCSPNRLTHFGTHSGDKAFDTYSCSWAKL